MRCVRLRLPCTYPYVAQSHKGLRAILPAVSTFDQITRLIEPTLNRLGAKEVAYFEHYRDQVIYKLGSHGTADFWFRRFARVCPNHLLFWLLVVLVPIAAQPVRLDAAIANLLLVQAWDTGSVFQLNGVAWSLSCEAFFYALFPALLLAVRRVGLRTALAVAVGAYGVVGVWTIAAIALRADDTVLTTLFTDPLLRAPAPCRRTRGPVVGVTGPSKARQARRARAQDVVPDDPWLCSWAVRTPHPDTAGTSSRSLGTTSEQSPALPPSLSPESPPAPPRACPAPRSSLRGTSSGHRRRRAASGCDVPPSGLVRRRARGGATAAGAAHTPLLTASEAPRTMTS